jgi:hypothetical protein
VKLILLVTQDSTTKINLLVTQDLTVKSSPTADA